MALGTVTPVSENGRKVEYVAGNKRIHLYVIQPTAGANYVQGGTTITAAQVGLKRITYANPLGLAMPVAGGTGVPVSFKRQTDGSVKMFVHTSNGAAPAALAEAATNGDYSTFTVDVEFIGTHRA
jgi:hypothetical protein